MPPQPQTPSKVDDEIERIKLSLHTKWGIRFPVRDATPSKRDMSRVENRIVSLIQFLYFNGRALDHAIERFEENAVQIASQWQFKPHGESDVLPVRAHSESALQQDFLKRSQEFSPQEVTELTKSLEGFLKSAKDRVRAGEKFQSPVKIDDHPIAMNKVSPIKPNMQKRQASPKEWLQSKNGPGSAKSKGLAPQHPSSDDYPDDETAEYLANFNPIDTTLLTPSEAVFAQKTDEPAEIEQGSSSDDTFHTPPTSPLKDSGVEPFATRKRPFPDSMRAPSQRNVFQKTFSDSSAQETIYQPYSKTTIPVLPPDKISVTARMKSQSENPKHLAQNEGMDWEISTSLDSFENKMSTTPSATSTSSAGTSTNTSFSARSLATSFDSSIDGTDITKSGPRSIPSAQPLLESSLPGPQSIIPNRYQDDASTVSTDTFVAPPDPMDIDSESTTYPKPCKPVNIKAKYVNKTPFQFDTLGIQDRIKPNTSSERAGELLTVHLHENSPFVQVPSDYPPVPLRQLYEITRVASACKLDIEDFSTCFESDFESSYDKLWSSLISIAKLHGAQVPERSSLIAWKRAGSGFEGVALTGKLQFLDQRRGPCFEFLLNPLRLEHSDRLSRQFGSDRFCVVGLPPLERGGLPSYLKPHQDATREAIANWLVDTEHKFLGCTWRAFWTRSEKTKKGARKLAKDSRYRIYLFAEDSVRFRARNRSGEMDPCDLDRVRISVSDLIEWFMPFKHNRNQPSLKFYARLQLAVSSTIATVKFSQEEIFRADDARADTPGQWRLNRPRSIEKRIRENPQKSESPVMNDGCARISRRAARAVADCLGLDNVPCVFQGRIGGAKGMWMIDPQDETPPKTARNYWIEITDSQLKFEGHALDEYSPEPARVTFEVNTWAKRLSSSSVKFQLLPILVDRGVPPGLLANLLERDLTACVGEMKVAMESGLALRKWNQEVNPVTTERAKFGGIEMQGGMPSSRAEKLNWFAERGFEPKTCRYLKDNLYQTIKAYCDKLENKMHIKVGQSTNAYMIADPLAILEENEIHLGFSGVFHDPESGFDQSMLHNMDVLVARSPAHLPSDIQKVISVLIAYTSLGCALKHKKDLLTNWQVRAVFKPELMMYRDVIVFPSKGSVPLASKLSGGDYDGDKAWVCWHPDIVQPFKNADVPPSPRLETYGFEKDTSKVADFLPHSDYMNKFLRHSFNFSLRADMLGQCSLYHERYCYHNKAIDSPQAVSIALLLGNLVDSAKGGLLFDENKWFTYLTKNQLATFLPSPAFRDKNNAKPTDNLIDHLVFVVAKSVRQKALGEFAKQFADVSPMDDDLFRIRHEEYEEAKGNKHLAIVLKNLDTELKKIHDFWSRNAKREDDIEDIIRPSRKSDTTMTFRNLVEKCRADFLNLKPTLDDDDNESAPPGEATSDRISHWQRDHARGRSSYWDLLKASVAFHLFYRSTFIWHVAGVELGEIKATAKGRGSYRAVVGEVFDAFKLDKRAVEGAMRREVLGREVAPSFHDEQEEEEEEDEFGVWDWGVDDC